ncbi:MAG: AsmA family protein [Alphaproteobacteria bacterium]|nr:AsmA family protein [Alphaproteobacteria bacterium]
MKKIFKKIKSLIMFKKKEPWYKKCCKNIACVLDMKRRNMFIMFFGLLFVALYLSSPSLESIVKELIHEYGSKVIGTDTSIKGLDFKPTSGYVAVEGIKVSNPKGYKSDNLFYLEKLGVQIDIPSITNDVVIINTIEINQPEITYEMLSFKQNNVSDVLKNLKSSIASSEKEKLTENKKTVKKAEKTASKKVIIKNLLVKNGTIAVMTGIGNFKKELSIPLPEINIHNIGQERQGLTIKETMNLIIGRILNLASETVISQNLENLKENTANELKNLTSGIKNEAELAKDKVKDGLKNLIKL